MAVRWVGIIGDNYCIPCLRGSSPNFPCNSVFLGGGNSNMFYFHPYLGKGWFNHQLVFFFFGFCSDPSNKNRRTERLLRPKRYIWKLENLENYNGWKLKYHLMERQAHHPSLHDFGFKHDNFQNSCHDNFDIFDNFSSLQTPLIWYFFGRSSNMLIFRGASWPASTTGPSTFWTIFHGEIWRPP